MVQSARSIQSYNEKITLKDLPTVYKENTKPPSYYIFTPFIEEVKTQNEKMINMKKNMRAALLSKLGQNSEV